MTYTCIAVFSLCLTIHPDIVKGSHWILTWDIKNRKGMIMFWSVVPFYRHNWKASGCIAWKRSEFKRADKELSTNIPFWWSLCNELPHFACSHKEKLKHQNSSVDFNSKRFLLCLKKGGFVLGIWSFFFRSARHRDVNHCHEAGPWGVWGWHDACRAVQGAFIVFLPPSNIFPLERLRSFTDRPGFSACCHAGVSAHPDALQMHFQRCLIACWKSFSTSHYLCRALWAKDCLTGKLSDCHPLWS